jgi:hypothetical protein
MNKEDLLKKKEALIHQLHNVEGALLFIDGLLKEIEEDNKKEKKDEIKNKND